MRKETRLRLQIELLSYLLVGIATVLVLWPVHQSLNDFPFLYSNALFVAIFLTFTRYLFLLPHSLLGHWQPAKFIVIFICVPLVFREIELINGFHAFFDEEGLAGFDRYFKAGLSMEEKMPLIDYIKREYVFFSVSATIVSILLPFRLLVSYWRVYNQVGKV